jgi:hypothetical protein
LEPGSLVLVRKRSVRRSPHEKRVNVPRQAAAATPFCDVSAAIAYLISSATTACAKQLDGLICCRRLLTHALGPPTLLTQGGFDVAEVEPLLRRLGMTPILDGIYDLRAALGGAAAEPSDAAAAAISSALQRLGTGPAVAAAPALRKAAPRSVGGEHGGSEAAGRRQRSSSSGGAEAIDFKNLGGRWGEGGAEGGVPGEIAAAAPLMEVVETPEALRRLAAELMGLRVSRGFLWSGLP